MASKLFVDTLFLVALVNPRDPYHSQVIAFSHLLESHPLLITDAVFLELGNSLSKNHRSEVVEVIESFLASDQVEVVRLTSELFNQALALYKSSQDKAWGLVDCVSFVVMRQAGISEVLTLDRHFIQAGLRTLMGVP